MVQIYFIYFLTRRYILYFGFYFVKVFFHFVLKLCLDWSILTNLRQLPNPHDQSDLNWFLRLWKILLFFDKLGVLDKEIHSLLVFILLRSSFIFYWDWVLIDIFKKLYGRQNLKWLSWFLACQKPLWSTFRFFLWPSVAIYITHSDKVSHLAVFTCRHLSTRNNLKLPK